MLCRKAQWPLTFAGPLTVTNSKQSKRSIRWPEPVLDVSDSASVEDKVMLVACLALFPASVAHGLLAWGETSADECVLMSVRHGSQQSMGQCLLTRPALCNFNHSLSGKRESTARILSLFSFFLGMRDWNVNTFSISHFICCQITLSILIQ